MKNIIILGTDRESGNKMYLTYDAKSGYPCWTESLNSAKQFSNYQKAYDIVINIQEELNGKRDKSYLYSNKLEKNSLEYAFVEFVISDNVKINTEKTYEDLFMKTIESKLSEKELVFLKNKMQS